MKAGVGSLPPWDRMKLFLKIAAGNMPDPNDSLVEGRKGNQAWKTMIIPCLILARLGIFCLQHKNGLRCFWDWHYSWWVRNTAGACWLRPTASFSCVISLDREQPKQMNSSFWFPKNISSGWITGKKKWAGSRGRPERQVFWYDDKVQKQFVSFSKWRSR